jgi:hypothetical protein
MKCVVDRSKVGTSIDSYVCMQARIALWPEVVEVKEIIITSYATKGSVKLLLVPVLCRMWYVKAR